MQEVITWFGEDAPPDDFVSVIICDLTGEVGEGFREAGEWRWACAALITGGNIRAWAHLPAGPKARKKGRSKR